MQQEKSLGGMGRMEVYITMVRLRSKWQSLSAKMNVEQGGSYEITFKDGDGD